MSETTFRFREFTVHQEKCAMKVGTDAVLLGSWINLGNAINILDIGTGTGVIALMLAQQSTAVVDAIDIDEGAYQQARENFRISPWFMRMAVEKISLQDFVKTYPNRYDIIVSNPPYFHNASKPLTESRLNARHSGALSFEDLSMGVNQLLKPGGRFYVIFPKQEGLEFMDIAQAKGLFCHRMARVRTIATKDEKRLLMEFRDYPGVLSTEEIIIQNDDHTFSEQYIQLTKPFYFQLRTVPPLPQ